MKELVNIFVAKVFVYNAVDEHNVLNDSVAHWMGRFNLMATALAIGHLEGEFTLTIDTVSTSLVILMQDREGMVLPIKTSKRVKAIL